MSFIGDLLSAAFGSGSDRYSGVEHFLTRGEIDMLVSSARVQSLSQAEAKLIRDALDKRRRGDGKISERQIHQTLAKLEAEKKISGYDSGGVKRVIHAHFEKKFGKKKAA